jgi:copper(I)-binding protein
MFSRRAFLLWAAGVAAIFCSTTLWAAKDFVQPRAENASSYPCKDAHPTEKITAAVDVYNASPKDDIFVTPYNQEGILPVFLVITNDGDQPITLKNMRAELVTAKRAKLESLTNDDIFRRVAHISGSSTSPQRVGPIPLPGNTKNKKAQKQYEEILNANFAAAAVEPHTTKSGFLFFDVQDVKQPVVEGARVYLTGMVDNAGNELMYFDIPASPSSASTSSQP